MQLTITALPPAAIQPLEASRSNETAAMLAATAQTRGSFMNVRRELGLTFGFISHNLDGVEHFSDRAAIIHLGTSFRRGARHLDDR